METSGECWNVAERKVLTEGASRGVALVCAEQMQAAAGRLHINNPGLG